MNIKSKFPIFKSNPDLVYLDSGSTALKPKVVVDKEIEYMTQYSANIHRGNYDISLKASEEYDLAREKVAKFLGGKNDEIVFVKNATEAINLLANSLEFEGGVVVSRWEHHSNFVPWQVRAKKDSKNFRIWDLKEELDWKKVGLLAIAHVGNVTGKVFELKKIIQKVKAVNPKIMVVVDGCQAVAHLKVDVTDLGCDAYVFSGHKLYGPSGVGVLWCKNEILLTMEPMLYGGGMIGMVGDSETTWAEVPEKFEAGTPPIAQVIALGAAIDFVAGLDMEEVAKNESNLLKYCMEGLGKIDGLSIFCDPTSLSVLAFVVEGVHAHDVSEILNRFNVCVRSGHHCAQPLHRYLKVAATTRVSFGIYNTKEDVDRLIEGLREVVNIFLYANRKF